MRSITFAKRNIKELIRDPLSIFFALLLPLFLLVIFQQFKIPSIEYKIENFTPSIILFSFSFLTLFTATLIASDRQSSLLTRLFATPMQAYEYILGYTLAVLPIAFMQIIILFTTAFFLNLPFTISILLAIPILLLISLLFIGLGILIGLISTEKSASGIGSIIVQLVCFTSGMYFSLEMVGKVFRIISGILPFYHALEITKGILNHLSFSVISPLIVIGYIIIIYLFTIIIFNKNIIRKD